MEILSYRFSYCRINCDFLSAQFKPLGYVIFVGKALIILINQQSIFCRLLTMPSFQRKIKQISIWVMISITYQLLLLIWSIDFVFYYDMIPVLVCNKNIYSATLSLIFIY